MKASSWRRRQRQLEGEGGAVAGSGSHREASPQHLGEPPRHREPQAGPDSGVRIESLERLEDAVLHVERDSRPVIVDEELDRTPLPVGANAQQDAAAGKRVAYGVAQQIHENLLQPYGIGLKR